MTKMQTRRLPVLDSQSSKLAPHVDQALQLLVEGRLVETAAKVSGMNEDQLRAFKRTPMAEQIMHDKTARLIKTELLPMAIRRIRALLSDETTSQKTLVDLYTRLSSQAGHGAVMTLPGGQEKDITAMTQEELFDFIQTAEKEKSARAKTVNATVIDHDDSK